MLSSVAGVGLDFTRLGTNSSCESLDFLFFGFGEGSRASSLITAISLGVALVLDSSSAAVAEGGVVKLLEQAAVFMSDCEDEAILARSQILVAKLWFSWEDVRDRRLLVAQSRGAKFDRCRGKQQRTAIAK